VRFSLLETNCRRLCMVVEKSLAARPSHNHWLTSFN
jgi:hypothetical protein